MSSPLFARFLHKYNLLHKVISGALLAASITVGIIVFHNFERHNSLSYFWICQMSSVILSAIIGGKASYEYVRSKMRWQFRLKVYFVLFCMQFLFFGIEAIKTKKSVISYVPYFETDAVIDGVVQIVVAVAFVRAFYISVV